MPILTFQDALAQSEPNKRHVLLGNGFSMAWRRDLFSYQALIDQADFAKAPEVRAVFDLLGTSDFEIVIKALQQASVIVGRYVTDATDAVRAMQQHAEMLKQILVEAIAGNHPDHPARVADDQYRACRQFLSHFKHKYTLNYDLLLYWALMHDDLDELTLGADDGFRNSENGDTSPYVVWESHDSSTIHFLHGALHLFDAGTEIRKYTWRRTQIPLMVQIREALDQGMYPIYVAEGDSQSKLQKIGHSAYLHKAFRSLRNVAHSMFVFGHSFAENDEHILKTLELNLKIRKLFVSLHGDENSPNNLRIKQRANQMAGTRSGRSSLDVAFYQSESAQVWG